MDDAVESGEVWLACCPAHHKWRRGPYERLSVVVGEKVELGNA